MIRDGLNYKRGLEDDREVWNSGQRVIGVAANRTFASIIDTIAGLYDLQSGVEHKVLTAPGEHGAEGVARAFSPPKTKEELLALHEALALRATATFGLVCRPPEVGALILMAFRTAISVMQSQFADNILRQYATSSSGDLFLAHASIGSGRREEEDSRPSASIGRVRVLRETSEGIVVHSGGLLSTCAPIADELLVFPLPGHGQAGPSVALSFILPLASTGLKLLCRPSLVDGSDSSSFSARFHEPDATCIFDEVLVPWDRVLLYGDADIANKMFDETGARAYAGFQGLVRARAKMQLLVGVAFALADSVGLTSDARTRTTLGEHVACLTMVEAAISACLHEAKEDAFGMFRPDLRHVLSMRYALPRMIESIMEFIRQLGGSAIISAPGLPDLANPAIAEHIEASYSTPHLGGVERSRLLRLAWELSGHSFAQRQLQFEKFHIGNPDTIGASLFPYIEDAGRERVRKALPFMQSGE